MSLSKYNEKYSLLPAGFYNLGFTCYYNALLQALLSCTSFVEEILKSGKEDGDIIIHLNYLIRKIYSLENGLDDNTIEEIRKLSPITWRLMISSISSKSPTMARFAMGQQCAAEGFNLLLQSFEGADIYKNLENLFLHRRRNKIYCPECNSFSPQAEEVNTMFTVECNSNQDSKESMDLNDFLINQKSEIDKDCECPKCKVRSVKEKTSTLVMIPEILFVMAKKYKYDQETSNGEKIHTQTDFPENLSFRSKKGVEFKYTAVAQIEHVGSLNSGHYYAICKRKGQWFCINDTSVSSAEFKPTSNTYIVLYHII